MTASTPLERAASRVARHYKRNPEAVRLAMLGSLAVRLEPHLLRRLRLSLLPDADVGIEADLWFGPLVESRGVRAVVLNRHVVELLREKLAEERPLLRRVIALTEEAHAEAAATIRLEERLTALALLNEPNAAQAIDEALRPALRTMEQGGEAARQLAQWAVRALAQPHPRVRDSGNAAALWLSARLALGRQPILKEVPTLQGGIGDLAWLLRGAATAPPVRIGVEFVESGLAFAAPGGKQPQLELPATSLLMVSLAWKTNDGETERTVEAVPGRTVELDAGVTQVTLRTLNGDEYLLSAMPPVKVSADALTNDVFISYAHIDNQPVTAEEQGWVTQLHASLQAMLSMRLGRQAKIWRDLRLPGSDAFSVVSLDQLRTSSALVAIVSPEYVHSEWCMREARAFCEHAQQRGGVVVGNKSRVFKVIKAPVDTQESLPAAMRDVLGYEFFTHNDGDSVELGPSHSAEDKRLYNMKVADLAWDMVQVFKALEAEGRAHESDDPNVRSASRTPSRTAVYLAECSHDLKEVREILEGELRRLGYPVLPDQRLPMDEAECIAAVERLLARCALSIHLVGARYGVVPDGHTSKSVVVLQNELAVARAKSGGLARLLWLPDGTSSQQAPQQAFIDALRRDAHAQFGADLITGDLEEFKAAIHATLKRIEQASPSGVPTFARREEPAPEAPERDAERQVGSGESARLIYLICDQNDRKATIPIRKLCMQWGVEVELPVFEGDASDLRRVHEHLLATCDAVLVFYGAGTESWKREIDIQLRKMAGYRAGKRQLAQYTYLAEPRTPDKQDLIDMHEPGLIDGLGGFAEAAMVEFVRALTL